MQNKDERCGSLCSQAARAIAFERRSHEDPFTASPNLDRDPAHIAPIDGKEYADHYRKAKPDTRDRT
jgi:hypothetical protein